MKAGVTTNLLSAPRVNDDFGVPLFLRRETNASVLSATRTWTWAQQPVAGNLIIIIFSTSATRAALTWPDDFNYILSEDALFSTFVYWKIANGNEPVATFTFNGSVGGTATGHEYLNATEVESLFQATAQNSTTGFYENEVYVEKCTLLNIRISSGTVTDDTNYEKEDVNDAFIRQIYYIYKPKVIRIEITNTVGGYRNILLKITKNGTN